MMRVIFVVKKDIISLFFYLPSLNRTRKIILCITINFQLSSKILRSKKVVAYNGIYKQ